jgi:methyl-branched lipid omega-hydroxylase
MEEIVRWGTPVIHFRRTVTEDTECSPGRIKEGEKVVLWYNSGNRDERVFENPYTFDITREPNPAQIGFGAGGPHFCLGANLARREMTVMFDTIRVPGAVAAHHRRARLPPERVHQRHQTAAVCLGLS